MPIAIFVKRCKRCALMKTHETIPFIIIQFHLKFSAKVKRLFVFVQENDRYWTKQFRTSLPIIPIGCLSKICNPWHSIRQCGKP